MRGDLFGLMVGIGVAGGLFTGLMTQAPRSEVEQPHDEPVALLADEEPRRFPLVRFEEPPLAPSRANEKVIPASLSTTQVTDANPETAPLPRKALRQGRIPLIDRTDSF